MSEEESFVILGSSPPPSLISNSPQSGGRSIETSLKNIDLREAIENIDREHRTTTPVNSQQMAMVNGGNIDQSNSVNQNKSLYSNGSGTADVQTPSLATSFILGEVNADVLKNSVYSQFPSLCSMQACAEDVVKLQNLMTECIDLKQTLAKVNNTMKQYYDTTRIWREEATRNEQQYKEQLQEFQTQIDALRTENLQLKKEIQSHVEQTKTIDDIRQKECDELRQIISEKSSLISNMRVQMDKMERNQLKSFEVIDHKDETEQPEHEFVERSEHERRIKDFERQMSQLLAENMEFKDMQKNYIDELDCLRVNLTSAEELLQQTRAELKVLEAKDIGNSSEIAILRQQVDVYRRDFEMERADREKNAGEKEQYLHDLRALQRRNQELIEALAEANKGKRAASISISDASFSKASSPSLRENQRPVLDPTGAAATTSTGATAKESTVSCPICYKTFKSLSILQSHVNDCLDKH